MRLFKRKQKDDEQPAGRRPYRVGGSDTVRPKTTFSYYTKRSDDTANVGRDVDNSYNNVPKSDSLFRKVVRRSLIIVGALAVLGLVAYSLLLKPDPKIVALTTTSNQIFLEDMDTYQQAANKLFDQTGNRNKLTINTKQITESLLNQFPELADVSVTLPFTGHEATVYIQPSDPMLEFRQSAGDSLILDSYGKALVSADLHTDELAKMHLPSVQSQNDTIYSVGQTVLPSTTVAFIQTVQQQLSANHMKITSMILPKATSELDVYVAGQPFYGKFNTEQDSAQQQAGTYVATYRHLLNTGKLPHQYIDVRIDGRAYYK
ncbi:MAG TPA: hypothetical protein VLG47_05855 [Candidatus Saccharimonadales bacterium]|nr:hypothetical protein [Candidatus Saccharimonadales bacterium]